MIIGTILLIGMFDESFADKKIKLHLGQTINVDDLKFTLHNVDDLCLDGAEIECKKVD